MKTGKRIQKLSDMLTDLRVDGFRMRFLSDSVNLLHKQITIYSKFRLFLINTAVNSRVVYKTHN